MTTWTVEKFKDVRNKDIEPPAFDGHALTSNELMVGKEKRQHGL
jgi:insulysin